MSTIIELFMVDANVKWNKGRLLKKLKQIYKLDPIDHQDGLEVE